MGELESKVLTTHVIKCRGAGRIDGVETDVLLIVDKDRGVDAKCPLYNSNSATNHTNCKAANHNDHKCPYNG
jgi:hypothetical protein